MLLTERGVQIVVNKELTKGLCLELSIGIKQLNDQFQASKGDIITTCEPEGTRRKVKLWDQERAGVALEGLQGLNFDRKKQHLSQSHVNTYRKNSFYTFSPPTLHSSFCVPGDKTQPEVRW